MELRFLLKLTWIPLLAGMTAWLEQPLCDVMKITPSTGSATAGPVMFTPPVSPGHDGAGPAGSSNVVGGLNGGTSRFWSCATCSARRRSSGV